MSAASISVAMATYNGREYLPEQLASLAAQELLPTELVVCDDGSTDGTVELLDSFAATALFEVHVHRNQKNLGVLRNFERAASLCTGELVFLSDQDDVWLPSKIRQVAALFDSRPGSQVIINDKMITDESLQPTGATMLGNIRGFGSPDACFVAGCCSAFRREWLDIALPIPDGVPAHDSWLAGLAHRIGVVSLCEQPLQFYRRHRSNASENSYSGEAVGLLDRLRFEFTHNAARDRTEAKAYWDYYLNWHHAELRRIEEKMEAFASLGLAERAERARRELRELIRAVEQRRQLANHDFGRRASAVWSLWRSGGYSHFSGWKSAVKDIIAKR
jgi:glycosyltransferase involved in cell wall biosynthesis